MSKPVKKYRMVAEVTHHAMDGRNALERELNTLLTRNFIGTKDLPSDECLSEAKHIIFWRPGTEHAEHLAGRFGHWFAAFRKPNMCLEVAHEAIGLLKKYEDE